MYSCRKISYDMTKRLGLNNFSSNLIKYLLQFFSLNEYIEIKKICKNLYKIIGNMNLFKEYIFLISKITSYPKNITDTIFRDNATYLTKHPIQSFLTDEEKIRLFQNYTHFFLREKQTIQLSDTLRIGESGFYFLSLYLRFVYCKIKALNLNYNLISKESSDYLSLSLINNMTVNEIHLNGTNLSEESLNDLSHALTLNKHINLLEMGYNNNLKIEGIHSLCKGLKLSSSIQTLFLSDNMIKREGAKYIADFLRTNTVLKKLYIEKNELEDEGINLIANALRYNNTLNTINLSENRITCVGLYSLLECFNNVDVTENVNYSIKMIYLKSNLFNNFEATKILGRIISNNNTISFLDLSNNSISDNLILPISDALRINSTLETLILESNVMGGIGSKILCQGLKDNIGLKNLNLRNNSLGYEGGKNISELLGYNKNLSNINLQANLLDEHSITLIIDKLNFNREIKSINLMNNQITNIQDIMMNVSYAKDIIMY